MAEHNPQECGCEYLGNDSWSCGHIDNLTSEEQCDCDTCCQKYILIIGKSFRVIGKFNSENEAKEYARKQPGWESESNYTILPIESP